MYEIFEKLIKEKRLKAADVTRATGIKSPVFSEWKKGKSKPNTEKMIKIAKFLNVSVEYLMTGKEPNADYLYSDVNADTLIYVSKHKELLERIKKYISLNDDDKKAVEDIIDFLYSKRSGED